MSREMKNFMNYVNMFFVCVVGGAISYAVWRLYDSCPIDMFFYDRLDRDTYGVLLFAGIIATGMTSAIIVQEVVRFIVVRIHNYRVKAY